MNRLHFLRLLTSLHKKTTGEWWEEYGIRAEYIESNGTQYVDLGVKGDNNTNFEVTFALTDLRQQQIAGSRETYNKNNITIAYPTNGANNYLNIDFQNNENNRLATSFPLEVDKFYTAVSGIDGIKLDSLEQPVVDVTSFETVTTLKLFAADGVGYTSQKMIGKVKDVFIGKVGFEARYIPIQVKKSFTDLNGVTHKIGDWIIVNALSSRDVPSHVGDFTGHINVESLIYFKSVSEQNPYYDLGRRIAYGKRIVMPLSFEDTELTTLDSFYGLFGSRSGNAQNTAYNSFITRNDIPNTMFVELDKIPLNEKFEVAIENGKGYINGNLMTSDTGTVVEYNYNTFLYNVNSVERGGAMSTFRLPIGMRVYGCQIYDVETGVLENNYQPQLDQTLKCTVTGEVLPKLGINETDSWSVKYNTWWQEYGNKVEYLTSDGTAYIETGYNLQYENGRTEIGVSVVNVDSATSIYGFIERSGNISNRIAVGSTRSGLFTGSGNTNYVESPTQANFKYEIDWNRKTEKTILNGVEHDTPNVSGLTATYPAYLFSRNDNGKPDADGIYNLIGNVYYLREYLDDVLQFNLVPIQVTKSFTSKNNVLYSPGDFIMVNELVELDVPNHVGVFSGAADNELMWFETVPSSTSIKTNFIPTTATALLTKIELMCSFTSGSIGYLVNGIGGGPTMYLGMNPSFKLAYGNMASDSSISYILNYDTYYKLTIDYKNKTILVNDEVAASDIRLYPFNRSDVNFGLNCYVNPNTNTIFNSWGQKTQYCKIYVDDILTHHWVGKFNDNKVDVYDKVEKVYLGDLGLIEGAENIIAGETTNG